MRSGARWIVSVLFLLAAVSFGCYRPSLLSMRGAVKYSIRVEKDGAMVKAAYDIAAPTDNTTLIADFKLYLDGQNIIGTVGANKELHNTVFYKLPKPDQDVHVAFSIATNGAWTASDDSGLLRGSRRYDDVHFGN